MHSLSSLHTFALPSRAAQLQVISDLDAFRDLVARGLPQPFWLLGEGSNTVFTEDFAGSVLQVAVKGIVHRQDEQAHYLSVAAGENWHQLVVWSLQRQIYGLENLALIPGTVGAAPIQNIGAYGVEVAQYIESVDYLCLRTAKRQRLTKDECDFAYRDSVFKQHLLNNSLIYQVNFKLSKDWQANTHYAPLQVLQQPNAQQVFDKVVAIRQSKLPDPKVLPNAGSFFKNPLISLTHFQQLQKQWPDIPAYPQNNDQVKIPAGWLIETLGFKQHGCGDIGCHQQQALVLVNRGRGNGQQLLEFARTIRQQVEISFGITLHSEVNLLGKQGAIAL